MRTFIAYCSLIFLTTSCQSPQVRTPTKTSIWKFYRGLCGAQQTNIQAREGYYTRP